MKTEILTREAALAAAASLPFAYIRSLSQVTLGPNPGIDGSEEWTEARFFDETREIRFFRRNGALSAVCLTGEPEDRVLTETYRVRNAKFGKTYTVCQVLEPDEDGQMNVRASRLSGWEGGNENG